MEMLLILIAMMVSQCIYTLNVCSFLDFNYVSLSFFFFKKEVIYHNSVSGENIVYFLK